ncbi:Sugar fermentation stimulation protein [Trichinella pseudospiralis]
MRNLAPTPAGQSTSCVSMRHCSAAHAAAPEPGICTNVCSFFSAGAFCFATELIISIYLDRDLDLHWTMVIRLSVVLYYEVKRLFNYSTLLNIRTSKLLLCDRENNATGKVQFIAVAMLTYSSWLLVEVTRTRILCCMHIEEACLLDQLSQLRWTTVCYIAVLHNSSPKHDMQHSTGTGFILCQSVRSGQDSTLSWLGAIWMLMYGRQYMTQVSAVARYAGACGLLIATSTDFDHQHAYI